MTSTTAPCLPGRIYLREPPPSSRHGLALSQLGITVIQSIEICSWAKDRLLALGFDPTVKMLSSVAAGIKETLVLEIITKYDDDFTCPDEEDKKYNVNALVNVIVHQLRDKFYPGRAERAPVSSAGAAIQSADEQAIEGDEQEGGDSDLELLEEGEEDVDATEGDVGIQPAAVGAQKAVVAGGSAANTASIGAIVSSSAAPTAATAWFSRHQTRSLSMEFQCGRPSEAWTDTYVMNWSQSEPLFSVPPAKFNAWIAQLVAQQHFDSSTEDLMYLEVRGARPIVANGADLEAIFLAYTTIGYPLYFTIINKGDPDPYPGI